jgi:hypothetical protein
MSDQDNIVNNANPDTHTDGAGAVGDTQTHTHHRTTSISSTCVDRRGEVKSPKGTRAIKLLLL